MIGLLQRKSPRAQRYDYTSPGGYFITICTKNRKNYFGEIKDGKMIVNEIGKFCEQEIGLLSSKRKNVEIDEYIIMPNHIHMILCINEYCRDASIMRPNNEIKNNKLNINTDGLSNHPYKKPNLGSIIKLFKGNITKYAQKNNKIFGRQSRYHDHIIRNNDEFERIKYYIQTNPENWNKDLFYE